MSLVAIAAAPVRLASWVKEASVWVGPYTVNMYMSLYLDLTAVQDSFKSFLINNVPKLNSVSYNTYINAALISYKSELYLGCWSVQSKGCVALSLAHNHGLEELQLQWLPENTWRKTKGGFHLFLIFHF